MNLRGKIREVKYSKRDAGRSMDLQAEVTRLTSPDVFGVEVVEPRYRHKARAVKALSGRSERFNKRELHKAVRQHVKGLIATALDN